MNYDCIFATERSWLRTIILRLSLAWFVELQCLFGNYYYLPWFKAIKDFINIFYFQKYDCLILQIFCFLTRILIEILKKFHKIFSSFFKPKHFRVGSGTARNRREIIREKDAFRLSGLTTIMMTQTTKRKMMILPVQSATFPPIHLTFTI